MRSFPMENIQRLIPPDSIREHPALADYQELVRNRLVKRASAEMLPFLFNAHTLAMEKEWFGNDGTLWVSKQNLCAAVKRELGAEDQAAEGKIRDAFHGNINSSFRDPYKEGRVQHLFEIHRTRNGREAYYGLSIKNRTGQLVTKLRCSGSEPVLATQTENDGHGPLDVRLGTTPIEGARVLVLVKHGISVIPSRPARWQPPPEELFPHFSAHHEECWKKFADGKRFEDKPICHFHGCDADGDGSPHQVTQKLHVLYQRARFSDYIATSHHRFRLLQTCRFRPFNAGVNAFAQKFEGDYDPGNLHGGMTNPLEVLVNIVSNDDQVILTAKQDIRDGVYLSPIFGTVDPVADRYLGTGQVSLEHTVMRHAARSLGLSLHALSIHWMAVVAAIYAGKCVLVGEITLPHSAKEIKKQIESVEFSCRPDGVKVFDLRAPTDTLEGILSPKNRFKASSQQRLAWLLSLHHRSPEQVKIERPPL
jgi:hypothetical protein